MVARLPARSKTQTWGTKSQLKMNVKDSAPGALRLQRSRTMVDRFFLTPGEDVRRGTVRLDAAESEHAIRSRRLREGNIVELLDGEGLVATGRIRVARKQECVIEIDTFKVTERDLPEVHLALSVPRGPRMDDLVDAINQLGIVSILPVVFERSVSAREDASPARVERWRRIAREAAKQSGEPFITKILAPMHLDAFLAMNFAGSRLLLHPEGGAMQLAAALAQPLITLPVVTLPAITFTPATSASVKSTIPTRLLVGPEGGITPAEVERAKRAGERIVQLGRSLLRIEIAALVACAMARLRVL